MPSAGFFFMILGVVVASAIATENATEAELDSDFETAIELNNQSSFNNDKFSNNTASSNTTQIIPTNNPINTSIPTTTSNTSISSVNSTINNSTTTKEGVETSSITPKPINPSSTTPATSTKSKSTSAKPPQTGGSSSTGIIILVVIIVTIVLTGILCYCTRKRGRHYSVEHTSRLDEVNIPLSAVQAESPADAASHKGLQTFESTEITTNDPQEPEGKPEVQEVQKAEAERSAADLGAESAALGPSSAPGSSEDKPKEVVTEQSPPAVVELSVEEKTDDEDLISNKTSVESLKETNENNSNNAGLTAKGLKSSYMFWDIPLNTSV